MHWLRRTILAALMLSAGAYAARASYRYSQAEAVAAPCTDALAAFLREHWECTRIYASSQGLALQCLGGDYAISDTFASRDKRYTSFIYTNLRTMQQGVCDCDKTQGKACEGL